MKVILIKPVKTKAGWQPAGAQIDVTKEELLRLGKKMACVQPLTKADLASEDDQDK